MDTRSPDVPAPSTEPPMLDTLGQLAGQFAHDINDMLASVMIGIELAGRIGDNDEVRRLLADVADSIRRQRAFTTAMARAARACERPAPLDAHALIESCSDRLRAVLDPVPLELALDAAHARIRCDGTFLRTALLHLAFNARMATRDGGRLLLATHNRSALTSAAALDGVFEMAVTDDGEGMSEATRRRAFEPFFSTRPDAHGLGLAQVRDTVRRAGGSVSIETAPDRGTTIRLMFPLAG